MNEQEKKEFVNQILPGTTPLMAACMNGHTKVGEVLIESGAYLDVRDCNGLTALMFAAGNGHMETTKMLLYRGADKDIIDQNGKTAEELSILNGHKEIARVIANWANNDN